jgi:hypothetical protein
MGLPGAARVRHPGGFSLSQASIRIIAAFASGNLIRHALLNMAHCVEKGCFGRPFAFQVSAGEGARQI